MSKAEFEPEHWLK